MVKITVTAAAKKAAGVYCSREHAEEDSLDEVEVARVKKLSRVELGIPIEHNDLIKISQCLVKDTKNGNEDGREGALKPWRLDTLLREASIYQPPPPPKPEPTLEYKALMQRLRQEEEQKQYDRMLKVPEPSQGFNQRFPNAATPAFNPNLSHGQTGLDDVDEVTYADVNRQMILIINVLISIITCSVFIWYAARHWSVPQRLGLSMSCSGLVAFAEVAIYLGYIRRIKDAKESEANKAEEKEIVETWVIDTAKAAVMGVGDGVRYRKGKHR